MGLIERPEGRDFDLVAVGQFDLERAVERRIEPVFRQRLADIVAGERFRAVAFAVPDDEIAELRVLLVGEALDLLAGRRPGEWFCNRENFRRAQPLQIVRADEQREIGEAA